MVNRKSCFSRFPTPHQVSTKHLDACLGELEFRFNNRENPHMFRELVCKLLLANNLSYKRLTANS